MQIGQTPNKETGNIKQIPISDTQLSNERYMEESVVFSGVQIRK